MIAHDVRVTSINSTSSKITEIISTYIDGNTNSNNDNDVIKYCI